MNIMLNKTKKFVTQLRHAMQWRTTQHSEISKWANQPKLDKFQLQCYSRPVFKVTATRFHAATQTFAFASPINSVIDRCRWNPSLRGSVVGWQATRIRCPSI